MDSKTKDILQKFSTQKVDLSLIDDLRKAYDMYANKTSQAFNEQRKIRNMLENNYRDMIECEKFRKEVESFAKEVQRKTDDLGIELDAKTKGILNQVKQDKGQVASNTNKAANLLVK